MTDNIVAIESKEDKHIRETATYLAKLHKAMYDAHIKVGLSMMMLCTCVVQEMPNA